MKIPAVAKLCCLLLLLFFISSDVIAQDTKKEKKNKSKKHKVEKSEKLANSKAISPNLTLADRLRRVSGVRVMGSGSNITVAIRGGQSSSGGTDPLYVLDNTPIGNSYSQVNSMVDVSDIRNITVLKGSEASDYGVRGNNGVIVITTKK